MKPRSLIDAVFQQEDLNFLLTNRIPRRLLTRFMGWFSRIENPLVRDVSIATWQLFGGDLHLQEAKKATFSSLHDCFIRELKEGARAIDPDPRVLVSPCDGIVVASGSVRGTDLLQAKGLTYTLEELLGGAHAVERYRNGHYVTLRLASSMYHRFHAPSDCEITETTYIPGDAWNVNPIALNRVPRVYCKNERAVIHMRLQAGGEPIALVAVGAILVGSFHLNFLDSQPGSTYSRPTRIPCRASFSKGGELGYFHHGSTVIVVATERPERSELVRTGRVMRMGQPLLRYA
jgi:phosphatidylserine decarboxylase